LQNALSGAAALCLFNFHITCDHSDVDQQYNIDFRK